jgi:hypothetical protein
LSLLSLAAADTHSLRMVKTQSEPSEAKDRRRQLQQSPASTGIEGSVSIDYSVQLTVGGQEFRALVDTGSSLLALAAAPTSAGCTQFYTGNCSGGSIEQSYGSGSWTGRVCMEALVSMGGLSAGSPRFAGILAVHRFLAQCAPGVTSVLAQGIVGMAYPSLLPTGADAPTQTLMDSVVQQSGISDIFSMQCCGWDGAAPGGGTLVLGGIDPSLYTGKIAYTPVTNPSFYCVQMSSPASSDGTADLCGADSRDGNAVVDSGTSYLQLTADAYNAILAPVAEKLNREVAQLASIPLTATDLSELDLPNLEIILAGGVTLSIPPHKYYQPYPRNGKYCYLLWVKQGDFNILGQVVLEAYYTVFDRENDRVGFALIAGCPSVPPSCLAAEGVMFPPSPPPPRPPPSPPQNPCVACTEADQCPDNNYGCGWCADGQTCKGSNYFHDGPSDGSPCYLWTYDSHSCPPTPPRPPSPPTPSPPPPPPPLTQATCRACTSQPDAGWCDSPTSRRCMYGTLTAPTVGQCATWIWEAQQCGATPEPPAGPGVVIFGLHLSIPEIAAIGFGAGMLLIVAWWLVARECNRSQRASGRLLGAQQPQQQHAIEMKG